jgi:hypothetical protein
MKLLSNLLAQGFNWRHCDHIGLAMLASILPLNKSHVGDRPLGRPRKRPTPLRCSEPRLFEKAEVL